MLRNIRTAITWQEHIDGARLSHVYASDLISTQQYYLNICCALTAGNPSIWFFIHRVENFCFVFVNDDFHASMTSRNDVMWGGEGGGGGRRSRKEEWEEDKKERRKTEKGEEEEREEEAEKNWMTFFIFERLRILCRQNRHHQDI